MASPGPIVENPWQGGPPQIMWIFLLLIFFLNSLIEIFLISPSMPTAFLWLLLNVSIADLEKSPKIKEAYLAEAIQYRTKE